MQLMTNYYKSILIFFILYPIILVGQSIVMTGSDVNGEASNDESGWSVSMNAAGDRMAIGAPYNDGNGISSGHVRVYALSSGSWTQLGSDIDGEAANDRSGYSVSMNSDGDRVAIGAYFNDGTGTDAGHVRIYEYSNSSWSQQQLESAGQ